MQQIASPRIPSLYRGRDLRRAHVQAPYRRTPANPIIYSRYTSFREANKSLISLHMLLRPINHR